MCEPLRLVRVQHVGREKLKRRTAARHSGKVIATHGDASYDRFHLLFWEYTRGGAW